MDGNAFSLALAQSADAALLTHSNLLANDVAFATLLIHLSLLAIWNQCGSSTDAALLTHSNLLVNVALAALSTHSNLFACWNQCSSSADVALSTH